MATPSLPLSPNFDPASFSKNFSHFIEGINFLVFAKVVTYFLIGLSITIFLRWIVGKVAQKKLSAHHSMLLRRVIFYTGFTLSLIIPFKESGFDVTALLGAAGIVTFAVAFASQTSISNFLSGIFLIVEKPFEIGDLIQLNDVLGYVLSIDLLSVKLRTKDNTLVRIPNQTLLNSQFKNVSRFPIRRCDINIRVDFKEDLNKIKKLVLEVANNNPLCLASPPPELFFVEFGDSAIQLMLCAWSKTSSFSDLQSIIQIEIQEAFNKNGIELPSTQIHIASAIPSIQSIQTVQPTKEATNTSAN